MNKAIVLPAVLAAAFAACSPLIRLDLLGED